MQMAVCFCTSHIKAFLELFSRFICVCRAWKYKLLFLCFQGQGLVEPKAQKYLRRLVSKRRGYCWSAVAKLE